MTVSQHVRHSILLILLGCFTYLPSLFGQMFWDDDDFIRNNQYVKEFRIDKFFTAQAVEGSGKPSNYFRPLQFSIYSILYQFFGSNPLPYKLTNILFHLLATLAVFAFVNKLCRNKYPFLPLATAIVFLIHPIQTEAVSYVSGLSDPLVTLFGMLSLHAFLSYQNRRIPIFSIGWYLLALLSKESGVIYSGIITVLWITQQQKWHIPTIVQQCIRQILPFAGLTVLYLFYHINAIQIVDMTAAWGNHPYTHSVFVRLTTFLTFVPTYLEVLLVPIHLFYDRDFSMSVLHTIWHFPALLILTVGVTATTLVALYSYRKKTMLPIILLLCFYISISPFTGIVLINGLFYEHYMYTPLVFFCALVLLPLRKMKLFIPIGVLVISIFILRSWIRQYQWNDPVRLYTHSLRYVPNSFRVRNNLASEYQRRGFVEEAIAEYQQAISLQPQIPNPYHNLGNLYLNIGNIEKAKEYFIKALNVDPSFYYAQIKLDEISAKEQ